MSTSIQDIKPAGSDPFAIATRQLLAEAGVVSIGINGGPGCGKTSLIEASIKELKPEIHVGVVTCDIASHVDAERMLHSSDQVVQVTTGQQSAPTAAQINEAMHHLDLEKIDLVFIENIGTLVYPSRLDLGQDLTAVLFSVAGGHDKPSKHPEMVASADVVILNKSDLLYAVPFDLPAFRADVRRLNPAADLIELSALHGQGVIQWLTWLRVRMKKHPSTTSHWFG